MKNFGEIYNSKKKIDKNTRIFKEKIKQAIQFHVQGNISEASKNYQKLISQGCEECEVFSNYGVILHAQGNLQDAELSFRKAIQFNPKYAEAYSNLGATKTLKGQVIKVKATLLKDRVFYEFI